MGEVKRYDNDPDNYYGMRECAAGEFVLHSDYDTIRAEVERLRADAARIDWLAEQFKTCSVYMDGTARFAPGGTMLRQLQGRTFREAIDEACGMKG